ncbi:cupin [Azorhizobium oxalatiphilum]|uniref:Cupin n=1 Tax=Azorhizobium oxalatiphilum TaxID=980631 RepID=A0A917BZB7_9HYPH|nr:cupin domain-containing protein [Azorhizobium oxalatiphilum]GGF62346.1 cupin [Azorhizobium oxalatiphilum]
MKRIAAFLAAGILVISAAVAQNSSTISVVSSKTQPTATGPSQNFTGSVKVSSRFQRTDPARVGGGVVAFEAGAHTAWHTHPLGQTLIVTSGTGLVQAWGEPIQRMEVGDVVWIPPGVKHWHGAAAATPMTHVAISESQDGKSVEWLELVTDDQYSRQ